MKTVPSSALAVGDTWYFTVRPKDGRDFGDLKTALSVTIGSEKVDLADKIEVQFQHKDTAMLCLEGCPFDGEHVWDTAHKDIGCSHDSNYCVRACISMIASYYGGHLSQDRISYYVFAERVHDNDPENDLGHGRGLYTAEVTDALNWALNGAQSYYAYGRPNFDMIKQWISSGRLILVHEDVGEVNWHAIIIVGYDVNGELVHIIDPAQPDTDNWMSYSDLQVTAVWVSPPLGSGMSAKSDEDRNGNEIPDTLEDSDNDGVCNFDEIFRFQTNADKNDTDGDGVHDKEEITSYTFLADHSFDATNLRKPDPDGDDRAELDMDSDNDSFSDGQEDLNHNGFVDPGETDPLDSSSHPKLVSITRIVAQSPVNLLVTDPNGRRVGYDPATQSIINEIDGAEYSGPGSEPQEITIPNPVLGAYKVDAIGTSSGDFAINIMSVFPNGSIIDSATWLGHAMANETYSENIEIRDDGQVSPSYDIVITKVVPCKTVIGQGCCMVINVTLQNQANHVETFNATIYANQTAIGTLQSTLPSMSSTTIPFTWNTTITVCGNYSISAFIRLVSKEIGKVGCYVAVAILGDVNADGKVNIIDVAKAGSAFGSKSNMERWNPDADLNDDGQINIIDISIIAREYGKTL